MNRNERTCRDACLNHPDAYVRDAAKKVWPQRRPRTEREKETRAGRAKKRLATKEETARLRREVYELAEGLCERCLYVTDFDVGHMHHLYGGIGRRRQEQRIETVAWLCGDCHRTLHDNPQMNRVYREVLEKFRAEAREARRDAR